MILNDKPNCQVSRILMNRRAIYVKHLENDSLPFKVSLLGNKCKSKVVAYLQSVPNFISIFYKFQTLEL
jgi:hypothetical protein